MSRIGRLLRKGIKRDEIAILVPTNDGLDIIMNYLYKNQLSAEKLSAKINPGDPKIQCGTMHNSKGLEFRVVFIAEANEDNLPNSWVLNMKKNEPDELAAYLNEQRSLLYVAMTTGTGAGLYHFLRTFDFASVRSVRELRIASDT